MRVSYTLSSLAALASASLRGGFQYRANAISAVISGFLYQLTGFVSVWIIVSRFNGIGGWTLAEITFLYGMRLCSHGVFYACFSQLFDLDRILITGEYDRFLVRPLPPLLQIFTRKLRVNCFGDMIGGLALLSVASTGVDVDWSPQAVFFLVLAVLGGALVEGSVQITLASLSFRFLNLMAVRTTVNEVFNQYGNYPQSIFPRPLSMLLTFVLPVAFVAFLPASAILDRTDELRVSPVLAWIAPLVGLCLFLIALRIWTAQSRHYQSAGT
jgi:ABC-2 type transport system permease protein